MNLDRDIDLNFYSIAGRNRFRIPILSELYHASSQQILWISVDGTLDNPQMHREVLPHVNDSLRQLFQPAERTNLARSSGVPSNSFDGRFPEFQPRLSNGRFYSGPIQSDDQAPNNVWR
jgi:hypothetical protein